MSFSKFGILLKGNHDNMTNAADHGDFPFYKYADEGRGWEPSGSRFDITHI